MARFDLWGTGNASRESIDLMPIGALEDGGTESFELLAGSPSAQEFTMGKHQNTMGWATAHHSILTAFLAWRCS